MAMFFAPPTYWAFSNLLAQDVAPLLLGVLAGSVAFVWWRRRVVARNEAQSEENSLPFAS